MILIYAFAGFVLIVGASLFRKGSRYEDFCVGIALPIAVLTLLPFSYLTGLLCPVTLDVPLRRLDLALGLDGFALTRWLIQTGWYSFVPPVYAALPLVMAIAWCFERSRTMLRSAVVGAVLAIPFYLLVPAAGPEYAFAAFPQTDKWAIAVAANHPRNCFPSMHFTWALLVAMNARNRALQSVFVIYAALMALATVAGGEHYFVDVIAAIPFAFAVQWISHHVNAITGFPAVRNYARHLEPEDGTR